MIEHKINGYLAKPFDSQDLASGINWVLDNEHYDELCKNARAKILAEFDTRLVVQKYIQVYTGFLENEK